MAIGLGTIKHPELALTENPWYTSVPTVLPTTAEEKSELDSYKELADAFSSSKGGENGFVNAIVGGIGDGAETMAERVVNDLFGDLYLEIRNAEWVRIQEYYKSIQ